MTLLSPVQVADYLQLSETQVRRLLASNDIPHFKIGRVNRVDKDELDAWLMNRKRRKNSVRSLTYRKGNTTTKAPAGESSGLLGNEDQA